MVKFISAWTGQPIYINRDNVQSFMQSRQLFNGKYFWVAGHCTITFSVGGPDDQPTETVIGTPKQVADSFNWVPAKDVRIVY